MSNEMDLTGNWRAKAYTLSRKSRTSFNLPLQPANPAATEFHTTAEQIRIAAQKAGIVDALSEKFPYIPEIDELPMSNMPTDRETEITHIIQRALHLFRVKNKQYGNAIDRTGVIGSVTALSGDISRLRQMVIRNPQHGQQDPENVNDKFLDILVQAAIGMLMVQEDNWLGED